MSTHDQHSVYEQYFSAMPCFVSVQDRDFTIVDCNDQVKETFNARQGVHCWEVYKNSVFKCRECPVERTFQTGKPQRSEEILIARDGEQIPVYVHTSPIVDEHGDIVKVLEILTEITQVKSLQRKLHKTQQQLQQLFDEVPCYVTVQDRNLKLVATNRMFRQDFGNGVDTYCYESYKHRDEPCLECPVAKTFQDGQSHQSEEVVTSMSGDQYHVLVSTAPLRDSEGAITQVVEMSTNITQIRRLQDQLTSLGLLVGSISHGIKGLISGLDGGMYLMESGLEKNDRTRIDRGWDIIYRNVSQIRNMVHDILYYAKDRELEFEDCTLDDFLAEIISIMRDKASRFSVSFELDLPEKECIITIDRTALRSALINLLENSFDSCRKDLRKTEHVVRFAVSHDEGKDVIRFDIGDDGLGMDRETQEKIFSLFFSTKGNQGTGLGLYIANRIISRHGGTINVVSAPREGAHFTIEIPRQHIREIKSTESDGARDVMGDMSEFERDLPGSRHTVTMMEGDR